MKRKNYKRKEVKTMKECKKKNERKKIWND